ncbi:MAG: hypothetical protein H7Y00_15880 [Fimbriimonadaceae bacterium]|nr:hypothetical protein [Chitinophagales bacterium]
MNNSSKRIGRPPVREAKLKDGFYVEIRNRGAKERGIKIHCANEKELELLKARYGTTKDIVVLGEYKDNEKV